jgi:glycosyltransferase involved in cell wall biosynthesis
MGRLTAQKGFDLLIEAFDRVAHAHPDWTLRIAGDGEQRRKLECLVQSLGLVRRVDLCGWVDEPEAFLQEADLFVLSSRYEGFPNALLEAMACGLAVVSFDCDSGPGEIVRHETDGLLVAAGEVDALARAMDRLMGNRADRERLGENAVDVVARFGYDAFFARWEDVLGATTRTCK